MIATLQSEEERLEAVTELRRIGVREIEIRRLLRSYPLERIERQLRWLRLRRVWKPSAFIVSAIINDFEAPAALYEEAALNSPDAAATATSSTPIPDDEEDDTD